MVENKEIDYKGIGEGLSLARYTTLSSSDSSISLSDGGQTLSSRHGPWDEHYLGLLTENLHEDRQPKTNSYSVPSAIPQEAHVVTSTNEQKKELNLDPLARYCCDVQTHEQLAVGLLPERQSFKNRTGLDESLASMVEQLIGSRREVPTSPWTSLSSLSSGDSPSPPAVQLDGIIRMKDSPEWQAVPHDEQAKYLHRISKLKRHLESEDRPRKMNSVRMRKRSKMSNESGEVLEGRSRIE